MSFQDVGRPGARGPRSGGGGAGSRGFGGGGGAFSSAMASSSPSGAKRAPGSGGSAGASGAATGAFSSAAASPVLDSNGTLSSSGAGYEQVSDGIVQYQKNVSLLEKMARSVGTKNDTSVLKTQYNLQVEVILQLGSRIESQLSNLESRLSTLPRSEASQKRSTHVKLSRDYRSVEQKFKNVQLEVKRKRGLAEARALEDRQKRQQQKYQQMQQQHHPKMQEHDGGEEGMRMQMQIQEDKINEEIMREREEEIRNIHKGMHQVNEIYKDLAHLVDSQQEGIDQIENQMESANENTASGLKHIEKANEHSQAQCVIS